MSADHWRAYTITKAKAKKELDTARESWWQSASREGFTELARGHVKPSLVQMSGVGFSLSFAWEQKIKRGL